MLNGFKFMGYTIIYTEGWQVYGSSLELAANEKYTDMYIYCTSSQISLEGDLIFTRRLKNKQISSIYLTLILKPHDNYRC